MLVKAMVSTQKAPPQYTKLAFLFVKGPFLELVLKGPFKGPHIQV